MTRTDGQRLTAVLQGGPSYGELSLNANGSFNYAPAPGQELFEIGARNRQADAMTIEQRTSGGVTILDVRGKMTIEALKDMALAERVRSALREGRTQILLNLDGVPSTDTMGLCNIVEAYVTTLRQGGSLKLVCLTPHVRQVFVITRLLTIFDAYESEAEAIASFGTAAES